MRNINLKVDAATLARRENYARRRIHRPENVPEPVIDLPQWRQELAGAHPTYCYWNYVAVFDSGLIKVGVTADPIDRFAYYRQEVQRHRDDGVSMHAFGDNYTRQEVLAVERFVCQKFAPVRAEFGREWFVGDLIDAIDFQNLTYDAQMSLVLPDQAYRHPSRPRRRRMTLDLHSFCVAPYTVCAELSISEIEEGEEA